MKTTAVTWWIPPSIATASGPPQRLSGPWGWLCCEQKGFWVSLAALHGGAGIQGATEICRPVPKSALPKPAEWGQKASGPGGQTNGGRTGRGSRQVPPDPLDTGGQ